VPAAILAAMTHEMINHRGPEFAQVIGEVTAGLKRCLGTGGDVLTLTGSGTGGLEAAVVNTLSPGDAVLAVTIGWFGDRIADIAQAFGANVTRLAFPAGQAADPQAIRARLRQQPGTKAVLVTHNESSTGVTNPLPEIAAAVRETDALLIVDVVSSAAGIDLRVDEWGIDVSISASQKAWAAPPGLAMLSLSERAWAAYRGARMPRYYWDLGQARAWLEKGQTLATPAISIYFALREALRLLEQEGLENAIARHRRVAEHTRAGVAALGLELFADPTVASNTVTAIRAPAGVDGNAVVGLLRDEYSVELAGGQGPFAGKIFRIGHLGWVDERAVDAVLAALRQALPRLGHRVPIAAGR
jgi:aspartate aminotransferase-like enzyme